MLIVGLGNPGPNYAKTRHNIGFMVIDELIRRTGATKLSSSSFNGELFKFSNHFLLKPMTFMNLSGNSIAAVKSFYKIDSVVVIHDDLDIPFGAVRFKRGGGHGGHNGLKSADEKITPDYIRIRVGIGKPEHKSEVSSFVLSDFSSSETDAIKPLISHICDSVDALLGASLAEVTAKYSKKTL